MSLCYTPQRPPLRLGYTIHITNFFTEKSKIGSDCSILFTEVITMKTQTLSSSIYFFTSWPADHFRECETHCLESDTTACCYVLVLEWLESIQLQSNQDGLHSGFVIQVSLVKMLSNESGLFQYVFRTKYQTVLSTDYVELSLIILLLHNAKINDVM